MSDTWVVRLNGPAGSAVIDLVCRLVDDEAGNQTKFIFRLGMKVNLREGVKRFRIKSGAEGEITKLRDPSTESCFIGTKFGEDGLIWLEHTELGETLPSHDSISWIVIEANPAGMVL